MIVYWVIKYDDGKPEIHQGTTSDYRKDTAKQWQDIAFSDMFLSKEEAEKALREEEEDVSK